MTTLLQLGVCWHVKMWYPDMWRYHFWQLFLSLVLHFIFECSSVVFGNLRKMFGKCSERFVLPSQQFWKIFVNLPKVVGNLRKIVKNAVNICIDQHAYIIKRTLHDSSKIWILCSCGNNNISLFPALTRANNVLLHNVINMVSPQAKRLSLLWLHNSLKST